MTSSSFFISLDKEALKSNVEYLEKYKGKKILPVVKANAYGHDIFLITKALYDLGVKCYAVARFSEALDIVENFKKFSIIDFKVLIFESVETYRMLEKKDNLIFTINNIIELKEVLKKKIPTKNLSLKLDFGYGRNGIAEADLEEVYNIIKSNNLKFNGIFSHLFSSTYEDGLDVIKKFTIAVNFLGKNNFKMIHLQNTAGTYTYDCEIATHIRVGVMFYGMQETGFFDIDLKSVFLSFQGKVESIKEVKNLKYVAYENLSILDKEAKRVAKIKIGYGDGFIKSNEGTCCLINKKEYRIAEVTMDNTFIEVDCRVKEGDIVYLYYRPLELKDKTGHKLFQHLILLSSARVKRIWKGESK